MSILIKGGRVVDPYNDINDVFDVLVDKDSITKVAKDIPAHKETLIDASGKLVLPGLVDMHVHLREPGREDKETIASGTAAALAGGVTSVLAMPNTTPAIDSLESLKRLKEIIQRSAQADVFIAAAITVERSGKKLVDIAALKKAGVVAISDDGSSVDSDAVMLEALKAASEVQMLVICHCEDQALSHQGVVNLGLVSTQLGLRGISKESEYKRVERDIALAKEAKARIHIAHVSCRESVEMIAEAKKKGVHVSAETAPHYFSLSEEAVAGYDTNMKMNPPLRTKDDVEAIRGALKTGVLDCIASDHAPHTENEKEIEFDRAEFGVIGLETELAVAITELIQTGILDWTALVRLLALNPAKILGINKGTLGVGSPADIIVVDPGKEWVVSKDKFVSKSKNSAFLGRTLKGLVEYTIHNGEIKSHGIRR